MNNLLMKRQVEMNGIAAAPGEANRNPIVHSLSRRSDYSSECLVVGNGPSARLVDYQFIKDRNIPFIGMNSAFRHWRKTGIFPDYYVSIDTVVTKSNVEEIKKLIDTSSISLFVLADEFFEAFPDYHHNEKILVLSKIINSPVYDLISSKSARTTGAWAIRLAAELGYSTIRTIGFDGIREEVLSSAEPSAKDGNLGLIIKETPAFNPNYFFSDYQQKGDSYQIPNAEGFTKSRGMKLHSLAIKQALDEIQKNKSETKIYSHSVEDFTNIILKSSSIGKVHGGKSSTNVNQASILPGKIILDIKQCYQHLLDKNSPTLKAYEFYFGRPSAIYEHSEIIDLQAIEKVAFECYFAERPTLYIKDKDLDKIDQESLDLSIANCIRMGGIIELELSVIHDPQLLVDSLRLSESTRKIFEDYPLCLFLNQCVANANAAFSFKLVLKDYLIYLTSNKANHFSHSRAISSQSININSASPGTPTENLKLNKISNKQNNAYLLIYHGSIRAVSINIALEIYSPKSFSIDLSLAPNRTTELTREKSSDSVLKEIKPGLNTVCIRCDYLYEHTVTKCLLRTVDSVDITELVIIRLVSVIALDSSGKCYSKQWHLNKSCRKIANIEIHPKRPRPINFVFLECDMIDKQGHYFRYATNLLTNEQLNGYSKYLLARKDMNLNEFSQNNQIQTVKCFDAHSWTIQTNKDRFASELQRGLLSIPIHRETIIYMYTGSIFHAIELIKMVEASSHSHLIKITCNLFWEMIKQIDSDIYLEAFKELKHAMANRKINIQLTAPTESVQRLVSQQCNIDIPLAPHPSTSFSDADFYKCMNTSVSKERKHFKTIFFPGVDTIHKGYDYGLQICKILLDKGYHVIVRPSLGSSISIGHENLKVVELGVSEEIFNGFLYNSDLIVLPYMPDGFESRTSGLVVDALFNKTFSAVIENTWLASFVTNYEAGIVLPRNSPKDSAQLIDNFLKSDKHDQLFMKGILRYFSVNSWEYLIDQILACPSSIF